MGLGFGLGLGLLGPPLALAVTPRPAVGADPGLYEEKGSHEHQGEAQVDEAVPAPRGGPVERLVRVRVRG